MTIRNWIFEENLLPVIGFIAGLVGYAFDGSDADAIRCGLARSNVEHEHWFEYALGDAAHTKSS